MMKNTKKNNTYHFFYDNWISVILFIIYYLICINMFEADSGNVYLDLFLIAIFSYISSLVIPEYIDKKCNNIGSKVVMWLTRIMFVVGLIYAIKDTAQPCSFMCFRGLGAFLILLGLIVVPLIIMAIYGIIMGIIKMSKKKKKNNVK